MVQQASSGEIRLGTRTVPYRIVPSSRARQVRLRIGPDPAVQIIVPRGHEIGDVMTLLAPSRAWILRHIESMERAAPDALQPGATLPYLGQEYRLDIVPGAPAVTFQHDHLRVSSPAPDRVRVILLAWYRQQAEQIFIVQVQRLAAGLGVQPSRITVRDQKTRWGSCSSNGTLSFNWRLMFAPLPVLNYVVVHELAHMIEHNHSPRFWDIVATHCPDYKAHLQWLREHGPRLALLLSAEHGNR